MPKWMRSSAATKTRSSSGGKALRAIASWPASRVFAIDSSSHRGQLDAFGRLDSGAVAVGHGGHLYHQRNVDVRRHSRSEVRRWFCHAPPLCGNLSESTLHSSIAGRPISDRRVAVGSIDRREYHDDLPVSRSGRLKSGGADLVSACWLHDSSEKTAHSVVPGAVFNAEPAPGDGGGSFFQ
jgi:hypothetical protein